jgi:hypothetical protein
VEAPACSGFLACPTKAGRDLLLLALQGRITV